MPDIFGRADQVYGGGLSADASYMFWDALPDRGRGCLVTQIGIQYQQPVRRIYEIGPGNASFSTVNGELDIFELGPQLVYYVVGRPEGGVTLARIAGATASLGNFYKIYGNPCNPNNNLKFVSGVGCTPTAGVIPGSTSPNFVRWTMNGVLLSAIGLNVNAQDMLPNENVQAMFVGLKLATRSAVGQPWVDL